MSTASTPADSDQNIVYDGPVSLPKPLYDGELPTPAPQSIPEWRSEPVIQVILANWRSILGPVLAISSFCVAVLLGLIFSATVLIPPSFAFQYTIPFAFNVVSLFVCVLPFLLLATIGSRDATLSSQCSAFFAGEVFFIPYAVGMIVIYLLVTHGWGVHYVRTGYVVICFVSIFCATVGYFLQFLVLFKRTTVLQNRLTPMTLALSLACGFNFLFVALGSSAWSATTTDKYWLVNWEYILIEIVFIISVPMVNIVAAGLVGKAVGEYRFSGKPLARAIAPALCFLFSYYFIIIVVFMPFFFLLSTIPALIFWMLLSVFLGMIYSVYGAIMLKRFRDKAAVAIFISTEVPHHDFFGQVFIE